MKLKKGIRDLLVGDAAISAIVGTRVYTKTARFDAATRPFILLEIVGARGVSHQLAAANLVRHLVEVVIFDDEDKRAWDVADLVRIVLDGFMGVAGATTFDRIYFDDEDDQMTWETDGGELPAYMARQRYACWSRR